jgi:hypothetical protein
MEKADFYFNQQIGYCKARVKDERFMHGQLATAYCGKGEKDKVYENLRALNQMDRMPVYTLRNLQDNHYYELISPDICSSYYPKLSQRSPEGMTIHRLSHSR